MSERVYQSREAITQTADGEVHDRLVRADAPELSAWRSERLVSLLTGIVVGILGIRVVLSLLGANRANEFAQLIYGLTAPLVAPFFGLFGYQMRYGVVRFEIETAVAMFVYAMIGYGIARLVAVGRLR